MALFGTKHRVDVIGKATSDVQQSTFSGGVEEGDCRFKQMSGAVELVAFGDVGPAQPRLLYGIPGVEIAVVTLRLSQQLNHLVGGFFKHCIWLLAQRPGYGFQPFGDIAILEDHAVKLAVFQTGGDAVVSQRVAGFCLGNRVVQCFPLVRDHHVANQALVFTQKWIGDGDSVEIGFNHSRLHHVYLRKCVNVVGEDRLKYAASSGH
ncbi:hypothetical protein D3C81_1578300 [compost metagenome]